MKEITLRDGGIALVDDEDYDIVSLLPWGYKAYPHNQRVDARHTVCIDGKPMTLLMHRFILNLRLHDGLSVDHIDGNGLNNQKNNLRIVSNSQNCANRTKPRKNSKSQFLGVSWSNNKWHATVMKDYKQYSGGHYESEKMAAIVRDRMAYSFHGNYVTLNYPELLFWGF